MCANTERAKEKDLNFLYDVFTYSCFFPVLRRRPPSPLDVSQPSAHSLLSFLLLFLYVQGSEFLLLICIQIFENLLYFW